MTHKIINLYLEEKYSYIILPLFAFLLYTAISFRHGSSCEEFCFPMMMYSLYELIKRPELSYFTVDELDPDRPELPGNIGEQIGAGKPPMQRMGNG